MIRIATRRSLLAQAQARSVGEALKQQMGVDYKLLLLETKGDKWLDRPLQTLPGKDFFVEELDRALLEQRADVSVHSYKDLSTERPEALGLAAVLPREDPRDILICHPSIEEKLKAGKCIRIGTSSPRRMYQAKALLPKLLPFFGKEAAIECVSLRGNIQTRLQRLNQEIPGQGVFDGILLALAGVKRVSMDLKPYRWMVLPLSACPTAPGQGALAVECRSDREDLKSLLSVLHDEETARLIVKEREIWAQAGGGCHQSFGVTWLRLPGGDWGRSFGQGHDREWFHADETLPRGLGTLWNGRKSRRASVHNSLPFVKPEPCARGSWWVSQARAMPANFLQDMQKDHLFVPGMRTALQLAKRGLWVGGQADGLGFQWFHAHFPWKLVGLESAPLRVLTNDAALSKWSGFDAFATHAMDSVLTPVAKKALREARFVWWASGSQYERCKAFLREDVIHACGYGKTAEWLMSQGIRPYLFPHDGLWESYLLEGRQHEGASTQST